MPVMAQSRERSTGSTYLITPWSTYFEFENSAEGTIHPRTREFTRGECHDIDCQLRDRSVVTNE